MDDVFLSLAIIREQYKQFLKKCYRQPLPDDISYSLLPASTELAVIGNKDITRKQADEFTKKSLHGLTEEILSEKAPIALDHIVKPREDGTPVRCVLVEEEARARWHDVSQVLESVKQ